MVAKKQAQIFIPENVARGLFGCICNNTITFESGATIWVPLQPELDMLRGLQFTATGSVQQLQQMSRKLISQAHQPLLDEPGAVEQQAWCYLNDEDAVFGPFSARQLHKFSSRLLPGFLVCHQASGIWLPLWLALGMMGLPSAPPAAPAAAAAAGGGDGFEEYGSRPAHSSSSKPGLELPKQPKQQPPDHPRQHQHHHHQQQDNGDRDMADADQAVLLEVAQLRLEAGYVHQLNRAVDMEIDDWAPQGLGQQQQQQREGPDEAALGLAVLGGHSSSSWPAGRPLLVLVVDTNVLLDVRGLPLLQQLQEAAGQRQGPGQQPLLQVLIPWAVLLELDKLKGRQGQGGVPAAARAAVRHLQAAMAPSSSCRGVYQAQSIQEFRAAAQAFDFGLPFQALNADDRILQAALSSRSRVQQQQQPGGPGSEVLLLTNDAAFRLKAQANAVAVASLKEALQAAAGCSEGPLPALLRLAHPARELPGSNGSSGAGTAAAPPAAGQLASTLPHTPSSCQAATPAADSSSGQQHGTASSRVSEAACSDQEAAAALACIRQLREGLSDRVLSIFKATFEELWTDVISVKPPWDDGDFLHLLSKHFRSTLQDHVQGAAHGGPQQVEASIAQLIHLHKQLKRHQHSKLHRPHAQAAAAVMQLLQAFGETAAAQQVAAAAAAAGSGGAAAGCAAAAGAGPAHVADDGDADNGTEIATHWLQQQQQHRNQHTQQQQQQQQQHYHSGHQHADALSQAAAAAAAASAAAAAAVPAPQLEGPCLRLGQLMWYTRQLLQAAMLPLQQLLQQAAAGVGTAATGPAADACRFAAEVQQQLQQVVQLLGSIAQHAAAGDAGAPLQQATLQAGLALVELCSHLLQDSTAGAAVAARIAGSAQQFAADGLACLAAPSEAQQLLHQLGLAAQQLQALLGQAARGG